MAYPVDGASYKNTPKFIDRMKSEEGKKSGPYTQGRDDGGGVTFRPGIKTPVEDGDAVDTSARGMMTDRMYGSNMNNASKATGTDLWATKKRIDNREDGGQVTQPPPRQTVTTDSGSTVGSGMRPNPGAYIDSRGKAHGFRKGGKVK